MARFSTDGFDDIIGRLTDMGEGEGEVADKMLMAGAEEVKKAWRASAETHGLRATGAMIDSIGYPNKPKSVSGIRSIDIYPQGKDRRGVSNAEKAFIQHYGSSRIQAKHWIDEADANASQPVQSAMENIFDEFLKEKGMI